MIRPLLFLQPLGLYRFHNEDTHDGAVLIPHTGGRGLSFPMIDYRECDVFSFLTLKAFCVVKP